MTNTQEKKVIADHLEYSPQFKKSWFAFGYWGIWILIGLLWLLKWVPWWVRSMVAWPFAWLVYAVSAKRRKIARINLQLCFPSMSSKKVTKIVRQHFYLKVRTVIDYGVLWWASAQRMNRLVRIKNPEYYQRALATGKSVIVLTCHSFAVEYGGIRLSADYQASSVAKQLKNPLLDYFLQHGRKRAGAIIYDRSAGLKPVIKSVRRGCYLYYIPDEDHGGNHSDFADFFNVSASTLTTLGRLAKLCNAVVVPGICYYRVGKGDYVMHLLPMNDKFSEYNKLQSAEEMNKIFEQLVSLSVPQYMWGMKLFNRRPAAEKNPYHS
ncbi:hypothetical protein MNBD_GAMMA12-3135 [hydrothermal vent metagenome]|uniref:Lipid A biosynthesis lauroyl acyltransferase n=1 Tax=hydrothermal vent metagenome TaxID=652676 RepID=A0A3B0YKB0_9ZZZZ